MRFRFTINEMKSDDRALLDEARVLEYQIEGLNVTIPPASTYTAWHHSGRQVFVFNDTMFDSLAVRDHDLIPGAAVIGYLPHRCLAVRFPKGVYEFPLVPELEEDELWHPTHVDYGFLTEAVRTETGYGFALEPNMALDAGMEPCLMLTVAAFQPVTETGLPYARYVSVAVEAGDALTTTEMVKKTDLALSTVFKAGDNENATKTITAMNALLGVALYLAQPEPPETRRIVGPVPSKRVRFTRQEERLERAVRISPPVTRVDWTVTHQHPKQAGADTNQESPVVRPQQTPHVRGNHWQTYWTGPGRTVPRVKFVRAYSVNTHLGTPAGRVTKLV